VWTPRSCPEVAETGLLGALHVFHQPLERGAVSILHKQDSVNSNRITSRQERREPHTSASSILSCGRVPAQPGQLRPGAKDAASTTPLRSFNDLHSLSPSNADSWLSECRTLHSVQASRFTIITPRSTCHWRVRVDSRHQDWEALTV